MGRICRKVRYEGVRGDGIPIIMCPHRSWSRRGSSVLSCMVPGMCRRKLIDYFVSCLHRKRVSDLPSTRRRPGRIRLAADGGPRIFVWTLGDIYGAYIWSLINRNPILTNLKSYPHRVSGKFFSGWRFLTENLLCQISRFWRCINLCVCIYVKVRDNWTKFFNF